MSELSEKLDAQAAALAELKTAIGAAADRVTEDIVALKVAIEEKTFTPGDIEKVEHSLGVLKSAVDQLNAIDPIPDNPPQ